EADGFSSDSEARTATNEATGPAEQGAVVTNEAKAPAAPPAADRPNEAIYESCEVKRAGADSVSREPPHFPLAVAVGRSGPAPPSPTARFVNPRPPAPEPEAEGRSGRRPLGLRSLGSKRIDASLPPRPHGAACVPTLR